MGVMVVVSVVSVCKGCIVDIRLEWCWMRKWDKIRRQIMYMREYAGCWYTAKWMTIGKENAGYDMGKGTHNDNEMVVRLERSQKPRNGE